MSNNILVDKYELGQSISKTLSAPGEEIRLDLSLSVTQTTVLGTVEGRVVDYNNNPVPNALVQIYDSNQNLLVSTVTNSNGEYVFVNTIPNVNTTSQKSRSLMTRSLMPKSYEYSIQVKASGTLIAGPTPFNFQNGDTKTFDFTLEPDPTAVLGQVSGKLFDQTTLNPISGAVAILYSVNSSGNETIIGVSYSNEYGSFIFSNLIMGNYLIKYSALGYIASSTTFSIVSQGQIIPLSLSMVQDPLASKGTISGIIKDSSNNPIDRADVILYKVNADSSLTPVAVTKTNYSGVYLFIYVPAGTYKVKSGEFEVTNFDVMIAPDLNNLTLSQPATIAPVTSNGASGVLAGGATIDATSGYAGYIGGPTDGSTTITVNVPLTGMYTLAVSHINSDGVRPLRVEINGAGTGTTYSLPQTPGWNASDALVYNIETTLNQGDNTIKFHGDGTNYAPSIGPVSITIKPFTGSVNAANGVLAGGATIDAPSGYAGYIGGPTDGSTTITINAPLAGTYTLGVSHINSDGVRPLRVDVNGVGTGTTYDVPSTPGWNASDALIYNITVTLNQGNNSIKFHGNGTNYAPSIGPVSFTQVQYNYSLDAINATLGGSATINGVFVTGIGGSGNGTVSMTTTVPYTGVYNLSLKYVSSSTTNANIAINGTDTGANYLFSSTSSLNLADAQTKVVNLSLTAGSNTITVK